MNESLTLAETEPPTAAREAPPDPAATVPLDRNEERSLLGTERDPGRVGVLLVDDDPALLDVCRRTLGAGFLVVTATSASEALAALERAPVGVLLADLHMPGGNGIELARETMRRRPDVICIIMSGSPDLHTSVGPLVPGLHRTVQKPVPPGELREIVAHAADVWTLRRRTGEVTTATTDADVSLRARVVAYECERISEALRASHGNKTAAARRLGITYRGLLLKMQRYGMMPVREPRRR